MQETHVELLNQIRTISASGCRTVFIEDVGGFIAGNPAPGSAMFNFGFNCGMIRGFCLGLGFRVQLVRPQVWQKHFGLGKKKDYGSKWKSHLKQKAEQLFPDQKVTLKTADCLLILNYAQSL